MSRQITYGIASFAFGALAVCIVAIGQHAERFRGTGSAYLLSLADRWGLVRAAPVNAEAELRPSSLLALTDEKALFLIQSYGIYLAVVALLIATWAEFKREDSLYLAAGSICGAGAVYLASHTAGLGCLILGAAVILEVRRARAA